MTTALALLVLGGALAGCSTEDTQGTSSSAARPNASLEAARTKLGLVQQDPCYTSRDLLRQWPVCGRWEEEVRNVANAAAGARPDDREITDPSAAVETGHEHFLRAGCPAGVAVTRLATGIAAAR